MGYNFIYMIENIMKVIYRKCFFFFFWERKKVCYFSMNEHILKNLIKDRYNVKEKERQERRGTFAHF